MGLFDQLGRLLEAGLDWGQVAEELEESFEDAQEGDLLGALANFAQATGVALNTVGVKNGIVQALQASVTAEQGLELMAALKEGKREEIIVELLQTGNMSADLGRNLLDRGLVPPQYERRLQELIGRQ